jgi:hypothetical protein
MTFVDGYIHGYKQAAVPISRIPADQLTQLPALAPLPVRGIQRMPAQQISQTPELAQIPVEGIKRMSALNVAKVPGLAPPPSVQLPKLPAREMSKLPSLVVQRRHGKIPGIQLRQLNEQLR